MADKTTALNQNRFSVLSQIGRPTVVDPESFSDTQIAEDIHNLPPELRQQAPSPPPEPRMIDPDTLRRAQQLRQLETFASFAANSRPASLLSAKQGRDVTRNPYAKQMQDVNEASIALPAQIEQAQAEHQNKYADVLQKYKDNAANLTNQDIGASVGRTRERAMLGGTAAMEENKGTQRVAEIEAKGKAALEQQKLKNQGLTDAAMIRANTGGAADKGLVGLRNDLSGYHNPKLNLLQQRLDRAKAVEALFDQGVEGTTEMQQAEAAQGLVTMIGGSSRVAQQQIEHMIPRTAWMDAQHMWQYLSGNPQILHNEGFINIMRQTLAREKQVATGAMHEERIRGVHGRPNEIRLHRKDAEALMQQYGLTPAEYADILAEQQAPAGGAPKPAAPGAGATHRYDPASGRPVPIGGR
jgi:hypothetical protein